MRARSQLFNGKNHGWNGRTHQKSRVCAELCLASELGSVRAGHHCRDLHDDDEYQRHFYTMWGNRSHSGLGGTRSLVGILAIGASLLMIGEFDLSMGANIALAGHSFRCC